MRRYVHHYQVVDWASKEWQMAWKQSTFVLLLALHYSIDARDTIFCMEYVTFPSSKQETLMPSSLHALHSRANSVRQAKLEQRGRCSACFVLACKW